MNAVVPACAISRFERLPVFRKKCCGYYTTISPEQTSRLKICYAAERGSVTAKVGFTDSRGTDPGDAFSNP